MHYLAPHLPDAFYVHVHVPAACSSIATWAWICCVCGTSAVCWGMILLTETCSVQWMTLVRPAFFSGICGSLIVHTHSCF